MYAMDVKPMPGLEHLPWAEVWFHAIDDDAWRRASDAARALGKSGLEVWTTEATPEVVDFLRARGYEEVRRYFISELDVTSVSDPGEPGMELATFAERPDLARKLYEIALESYRDQPGRSETRIGTFEAWRSWGLDPHRADACFIALDGDRVLGYGYLGVDGDTADHGFTAVARAARGRGVAGAIKRAQIRWAKEHGLRTLRTANEARLTGMRRMNERYGYRPLPAEIILRGPLTPLH
jgi:GNAT superfamily N-acetyltransferase